MDERLMEPGEASQPEAAVEVAGDRMNESCSSGTLWLLENSSEKIPQIDNSPRRRPPDQQPGNQKKKKKTNNQYKGYIKLCFTGLLLMGLAFFVHFLEPVQVIRDFNMNMREGSYIYRMWKAPPIKLYIKVFIFNITNAAQFLKGEDKKLRVEEVGPYTYSETIVNEEIVWNENKTMSFTPKRNVQFEPDMSIGDPDVDIVTVANIPLLGIASLLHNSSAGLNLALSTLVSYLDSQPLLDLPVSSFLWGYEDPLVRLAQNLLPSWINFAQFGILDRMLDEGINRVTMSLQNTNETSQFSIQRLNGSPGLQQWGYKPEEDDRNNHCNRVEGTLEGYLFPNNIQKNQTFTIYRRAFCRPLKIEYDRSGVSRTGYPIYIYKFAKNLLDPANPDNACYCKNKQETCLPLGLSDLSPCYYNFPVAISLPHFLNGNKSLHEAVDGILPDFKKHSSSVGIQAEVGVPVSVDIRLQTNLVVKKTKMIPRVKRFNNLVIPIFWMQVELLDLPLSVNLVIYLLTEIGPLLQNMFIVGCLAAGLILVFFANLRYAWRSGIFKCRRKATIISYRQKQRQHQKVIWRHSRYSQLFITPPPAALHEGRTR
ncbi:scavenger receptor class B member 1 [Halyomorpha halys]|uniref:scavenger receptor class B member 1 n=1 Tax=Halyomorpha halys TaxID=286706 RepID=UPI0006D50FB5|nr:scavenger receptor class B member 1-like [Halyomorpha halys]